MILTFSCAVPLALSAVTDGASTPPPVTTVFLCADNGDYSGMHELGFLQSALEDRETLQLPFCRSAFMGYLKHADGHRLHALTVTTGIGYVSADVCTASVIAFQKERGLHYDNVVLIGTSGFSPYIGGWNPTQTAYYKESQAAADKSYSKATARYEARPVPPQYLTDAEWRNDMRTAPDYPWQVRAQVNWEEIATGRQLHADDGCAPLATRSFYHPTQLAVGSICVTSSAFLMESGSCEDELRHSQCSRPQCSGFATTIQAKNIRVADRGLAERIVAASANRTFPTMPEDVARGSAVFWAANEAHGQDGTPPPTHPTFVPCAESTVNAIHVGAERDYLCREYTAVVLNRQAEAFGGSERWTAENVTCVQAMEAFGVLDALQEGGVVIPFAVIRTASNYDMYPQQKRYFSAAMAAKLGLHRPSGRRWPGGVHAYVWHQNLGYVPAEEYEAFVIASFHYSVKTATFVLSNYFLGGRELS